MLFNNRKTCGFPEAGNPTRNMSPPRTCINVEFSYKGRKPQWDQFSFCLLPRAEGEPAPRVGRSPRDHRSPRPRLSKEVPFSQSRGSGERPRPVGRKRGGKTGGSRPGTREDAGRAGRGGIAAFCLLVLSPQPAASSLPPDTQPSGAGPGICRAQRTGGGWGEGGVQWAGSWQATPQRGL